MSMVQAQRDHGASMARAWCKHSVSMVQAWRELGAQSWQPLAASGHLVCGGGAGPAAEDSAFPVDGQCGISRM